MPGITPMSGVQRRPSGGNGNQVMTDAANTEADNAATVDAPLHAMLDHLKQLLGANLGVCSVVQGQIILRVSVATIQSTLVALRDDRHAAFNQLSDLTAVDYPERPERFEMIYQLLSMKNNMRLRVHAAVGEGQAVPSMTAVYAAANWAEREVWDMQRRVVNEPVSLVQEFRDFDFLSPWEGMQAQIPGQIPGDEKATKDG